MNDKKIIFLGMPDMAIICLNKLIEDGFNVAAVVPPKKKSPGRDMIIDLAKGHNIPVFYYEKTPNEPELIEKIRALNADVGLICSLCHKLSKEFLSTTKLGYINCHPSLLPKYRGANPYFHIINNGDKFSAVTLHFAVEEYDAGPIVAQVPFEVDKKETMGTLFSKTNFMMADLVSQVFKRFVETGEIPSKPQSSEGATDAPNVPTEFHLDWNMPVEATERLVRAVNPFYNTLTYFRGGLIKIITGYAKLEKHSRPIGEISNLKKDYFQIAAKDGFFVPRVLQVGTWGIYDTAEFIEKFTPHNGEILK